MRQQVNLLPEELKRKREWLMAGQLAGVWVGFAALLVVFSGWDGAVLWQLGSEKATKDAQWQQIRDANNQLSAQFSNELDPTLKDEVAALRKEQAENQRLAQLLVGQRVGRGFAPYLTDLAQIKVNGVWLENIVLSDGGAQIELRGQTLRAGNVPKFIQSLTVGDAFNGHQFDGFELTADDDGRLRFAINGPGEGV